MPSHRSSIAVVVLSCGVLGAALAITGMGAEASPSARGAPVLSERIEPYPPGRWRLHSPAELSRVVLWVSQLLVRHQSSPRDVPFGPPYWQSEPAPPERTREQAAQIALRLAAEAARAPDEFARLARESSEEIVTRDFGGSLGGMMASEFIEEPQVLDALAQTPQGGVTRPVETRYGFHVFYRRPPPAQTTVSGAHIAIGHDDARWLHEFAARRPIPPRTRREALQLATELYEGLRATPGRFAQRIDEVSEHRDARWGGDFGRWSTREPTPFPREVEVLQHLRVGEVAAPIDTAFGYQIILRTPERERKQYASRALRWRFDPTAPGAAPHSRDAVQAEAEQLARAIGSGQRSFSDVLRERCRPASERWQEGRENLAAIDVLAGLSVGEVAAHPIEWDRQFLLLQRIDPSTVPPAQPALLELPAPSKPDVAAFVLRARPRAAQLWMRQIAQEFSSGAAGATLPSEVKQSLAEIHRAWDAFPEGAPLELRRSALEALLLQVERLLGPEAYASYSSVMERTFENWILSNSFPAIAD